MAYLSEPCQVKLWHGANYVVTQEQCCQVDFDKVSRLYKIYVLHQFLSMLIAVTDLTLDYGFIHRIGVALFL